MAGKQAKILTDGQVRGALGFIAEMRHPERNRVLFLLSAKAGLRAVEISGLRWEMVLDGQGLVQDMLEVRDEIAKKQSGRLIPLHWDLRDALQVLRLHEDPSITDPVIRSERGGHMTPNSIVHWFERIYWDLGYRGCSSHSGRRTMITKAAKQATTVGASLRDVQQLAGHKNLSTTQRYIEPSSEAKRKLVDLL